MCEGEYSARTRFLDSGKDGGDVLQLLLGLLHLPRGLLALDLRLVGLGQGLGRTMFVREVSCFLIPEYLHLESGLSVLLGDLLLLRDLPLRLGQLVGQPPRVAGQRVGLGCNFREVP